MEAMTQEFQVGLPWELLYADDLVLLAESENELQSRINQWMSRIEQKGLRINMGKTKVMRSQFVADQTEENGKWPCGMYKKRVGRNSIHVHVTSGFMPDAAK